MVARILGRNFGRRLYACLSSTLVPLSARRYGPRPGRAEFLKAVMVVVMVVVVQLAAATTTPVSLVVVPPVVWMPVVVWQ